ncbi:hypothetical protein D3C81_1944140 [compost metagenome]
MRTARIRKAQCAGYFVVGFADRIIAGASDNPEFPFALHIDQLRMPPGYNEGHARVLQFLHQPVGINMPGDMMRADQRLAPGQRQALGRNDTHQQCADESRPLCDRYRRKLLGLNPRCCQRLLDH